MDNLNFKKNIPNILTIFRIALVPLIIVFILVHFGPNIYVINLNNDYIIQINLNLFLASLLFIICCFTDFLDGFLARKWNVTSSFGKFWDPLADKILVNSVLFALSSIGLLPIWIPILILIRDIIMDGSRMWCSKKNIIIVANIWGKIKTFVLMTGIIYLMFFGITQNNGFYFWGIQLVLMYISVILSYTSLIIYNIEIIRKIKNDKTIYS